MGTTTESERVGAWLNLIQAYVVLTNALGERLEGECGLSLGGHELLARLASAPEGRLRMLDLSRLLLVSKSGITRLVDRMEAAGLVIREPSPSDRRATFAAITDRGRQALDEALPAFARGLEEFFSRHLLDPDVRALRRILRKILSGNGEWEETRCSSCFGVDRPGRTVPVDPA